MTFDEIKTADKGAEGELESNVKRTVENAINSAKIIYKEKIDAAGGLQNVEAYKSITHGDERGPAWVNLRIKGTGDAALDAKTEIERSLEHLASHNNIRITNGNVDAILAYTIEKLGELSK